MVKSHEINMWSQELDMWLYVMLEHVVWNLGLINGFHKQHEIIHNTLTLPELIW